MSNEYGRDDRKPRRQDGSYFSGKGSPRNSNAHSAPRYVTASGRQVKSNQSSSQDTRDSRNNDREYKPRFEKRDGDNNGGFHNNDREFKPRFENREGNSSGNFRSNDREFKPRFEKRDGNSSSNFRSNDREFKPRFEKRDSNSSGGFRSNDREFKPRFEKRDGNSSGGFRSNDREFKPRFEKRDGNSSGNFRSNDREFKPRFENRDRNSSGGFRSNDREFKPRFENRDRNSSGGFRSNDREFKPRFENRDGNSSGNFRSNDREFKPRFENRDGNSSGNFRSNDREFKPRFEKRNESTGYRGVERTSYNRFENKSRDYQKDFEWVNNHDPRDREVKIEPADEWPIRLNRYIANSGICSRRKADELIADGQIKINGQVITEMGHKVNKQDAVEYAGKELRREKLVYVLLNKPKDFITTTDDPEERKTVMQLVKNASEERIVPVGRLDRNTTGLLLLTNDGEIALKLSHPSNEISKIYHVWLDKPLNKPDMEAMVEGVELEDGRAFADTVGYPAPDDFSQVGIEIHSGKNRIVRRMFAHLGYEVVKLDRVTFAGLTKKDLPRGHWRYLNEKEISKLKNSKRL